MTFENIHIEANVNPLLSAVTPVDNLKFINSEWSRGDIQLENTESESGLNYPSAQITLENIRFVPGASVRIASYNRPATLEIKNSKVNSAAYKQPVSGNVTVLSSDISTKAAL
ncbi:hypothetical protein [Candidatus Symbiothrix dinenymphae]|uniref:hypothetical protein n=1 Tax=Candidatus Symbiothrix dinenymphae TaxID=467085 RepID=UPI000A474EEA|nr:hypothetical protein [Candidatus Symbiothrix dinenymphae]